MSRPWHKSLLLYLGLPGLLFILWAWVDSNFHHSGFRKSGTNPSRTLYYTSVSANSAGAVLINHRTRKGSFGSIIGHPVFERLPVQGTRRAWFRLPSYKYSPGATYSPSVVDKNSAVTAIIIPHWLIALIYLALWSLAFAWRHRRIKRAAAHPFKN